MKKAGKGQAKKNAQFSNIDNGVMQVNEPVATYIDQPITIQPTTRKRPMTPAEEEAFLNSDEFIKDMWRIAPSTNPANLAETLRRADEDLANGRYYTQEEADEILLKLEMQYGIR